ETRGHSLGLLLLKHGSPDEVRLGKINENGKPGLDRGLCRGAIRAVEGGQHLEAKRVTRTQAAPLDTVLFPALENVLPRFHRTLCRTEYFESIFAGITSAADV